MALSYRLSMPAGTLENVSQETYEKLQEAITALIDESGAKNFDIISSGDPADALDVRMLLVNDTVAP